MPHRAALVVLAMCALPCRLACADPAYTPTNAAGQIELVLKDHRFTPAEIHIPAGKRMQILFKNQDQTAEEFDSTSLKIEKVVGGGADGTIRLPPQDAGRYSFMGEFHAETAQGVLIAE